MSDRRHRGTRFFVEESRSRAKSKMLFTSGLCLEKDDLLDPGSPVSTEVKGWCGSKGHFIRPDSTVLLCR